MDSVRKLFKSEPKIKLFHVRICTRCGEHKRIENEIEDSGLILFTEVNECELCKKHQCQKCSAIRPYINYPEFTEWKKPEHYCHECYRKVSLEKQGMCTWCYKYPRMTGYTGCDACTYNSHGPRVG